MHKSTGHRSAAVIVGLSLTVLVGACANDDEASTAEPADASSESSAPTGTVEAANQDGDGTSVTVSAVDLEGVEQGWITIHRDLDGEPGPVVGSLQVEEGTSSDVVVQLDEDVATGDYWPMLHVDDGEVGTYEFPAVEGADLPVLDGEMPVMQRITLTVN